MRFGNTTCGTNYDINQIVEKTGISKRCVTAAINKMVADGKVF